MLLVALFTMSALLFGTAVGQQNVQPLPQAAAPKYITPDTFEKVSEPSLPELAAFNDKTLSPPEADILGATAAPYAEERSKQPSDVNPVLPHAAKEELESKKPPKDLGSFLQSTVQSVFRSLDNLPL